ncbi:MAG: SGNH/GDSL hydrolase family protein [Chitinophagaceae bacterium]|nr:SGNH/GDSL hydrolase family protein [Chitinophagaceae bacterium]
MEEKLFILAVFVFVAAAIFSHSKNEETLKKYTYLALGDSYTIGEGVPIIQSFPYQTVQLLRRNGLHFNAPEIIAVTGWTTQELLTDGIDSNLLQSEYDFVTLLIGASNQYHGYALELYKNHFETLVKQAVALAGRNRSHVIVLSIPNGGITSLAATSGKEGLLSEIDTYNAINRQISSKYNVHYVDITFGAGEPARSSSSLASDGVHPLEKQYGRWAIEVSDLILQQLH